jgi:uncharacterized protein involved in cysteine biosynthesis
MEKLNFDKKSLRRFGITMGIAFLVITLLILIKHRYSIMPTIIISAVFFVMAILLPLALKPVYIVWMSLAFVLGWVNTRLILAVIFYLVFTPVGIILRLLRKDLLERRIEKGKISYWKKKETLKESPLQYERQF